MNLRRGHDSALISGDRRRPETRESYCEERAVSDEKPTQKNDVQPDTIPPYRPLGLKAVIAAALMLKRKPKLTPTG